MSRVLFEYRTNLCYCLGSNFAGECLVEMSDAHLKFFQLYSKAVNDNAKGVVSYLDEEMPEMLRDCINNAIALDIKRRGALRAVETYGVDCFENMSQEEFESLSMDNLVESCVKANWNSKLEYQLVMINIKDISGGSKHVVARSPRAKTMYVMDDGENLSMARCVPKLVEIYVEEHPEKTYFELKELFHDDLIRQKHRHLGVLCTKEQYDRWSIASKESKKKYHIEGKPLVSGDGVEFYVNNQWSKDVFEKVLQLAKALGFEVNV